MSIDIVVTKRSSDYHAALADNPLIWECAKSRVEAIGKLVVSAGRLMGITSLDKNNEKPTR